MALKCATVGDSCIFPSCPLHSPCIGTICEGHTNFCECSMPVSYVGAPVTTAGGSGVVTSGSSKHLNCGLQQSRLSDCCSHPVCGAGLICSGKSSRCYGC